MPLSKYFGGAGAKVLGKMTKEYGKEKGKKVFYATANKMDRSNTKSHDMKSLITSNKKKKKNMGVAPSGKK